VRRAIKQSIQLFSETFDPKGPVVELGSYRVPGYEENSNLRQCFAGREYVGCDIRAGNGVDRIEDAEQLTFEDASVKTLLAFELLEHLRNPQRAVSEAYRVLDEHGLLALSVPFTYRLHGFPSDYWRFTASGVYQLLSDFPDKLVCAIGPRLKPAFVFAIACKSASPEFTERKARFEHRSVEIFRESRLRGFVSVMKERGRDFFGHMLGRSDLNVRFYDGSMTGGYVANLSSETGDRLNDQNNS
jgi:SAM-dependent methyltransferase